MRQEISDDAIRDIKRMAADGAVTYLRVKPFESDRKLKSKG